MGSGDTQVAAWPDLAQVLRHKFALFTGCKRPISDKDLAYLYEKLFSPSSPVS